MRGEGKHALRGVLDGIKICGLYVEFISYFFALVRQALKYP